MSDKVKWPAIDAMKVAEELIHELAPACERICFAGSLRRRKSEVGDVELIYIPKTEMRGNPDDIFYTPIPTNLADLVIGRLETNHVLSRRKNVNGFEMFGDKNKLMVHVTSGIPVDLFATTAENWWVTLVVRTGSKETNLRLTSGAIARGGSLNAYGCGVKWRDGHISVATSEKAVFDLCGVPFIPPEAR